MNLTDFEETPVHRVFEAVKREAARYGVLPTSSEIVGLIPKKALEQAAEWFLQVENFDSSLILENRLAGGWQRFRCQRSHGSGARQHGGFHVAREESLSAAREGTERSHCPSLRL